MALDEPSRNLKFGVLDATSTFNSQPRSTVSQPQILLFSAPLLFVAWREIVGIIWDLSRRRGLRATLRWPAGCSPGSTPLGLVVAITATSAAVVILSAEVAQLRDITDVPGTLPWITLPDLGSTGLLVPAVALAFRGSRSRCRYLGEYAQPGRRVPRRIPGFHRQGRQKRPLRSVLRDAGGSVDVGQLSGQSGRARSELALIIASGRPLRRT
jgi:hypothetical protein